MILLVFGRWISLLRSYTRMSFKITVLLSEMLCGVQLMVDGRALFET